MYGVTLPELPPAERLGDIWLDMGCASGGSWGVSPLSWQEISAYSGLTGTELAPLEAQCLVDMSRAYVQAVNDTNPLSIAPMERDNG